MRAPFEFIVPGQRRAPFKLTARTAKGTASLHVPVQKNRARMPVQGPFRAHVERLIELGAIIIPNGGALPPAEAAPAEAPKAADQAAAEGRPRKAPREEKSE